MLYFYCGENTYLLEEKLRIFKQRYFAKFPHALNFHSLDLAEAPLRAVQELAEAQPLFSETTLLFASGVADMSTTESEELMDILITTRVAQREDVVFVLYARQSKKEASKKKKFFSFLAKHGRVQEFVPLAGARLFSWIKVYVNERGASIELSVGRELVERCGEDMQTLSQVLEKLIAYSGGREISFDMVQALVPQAVNTDVFKTIHALGERDVSCALLLLQAHRDVGDDPFVLLGMFAYEVRTLLYIKDALSRGEEGSLKSVYGIHPFVLQKNRALCDAFSLSELTFLHTTLAGADLAAKTGQKDPYEALEDVVLAFSR